MRALLCSGLLLTTYAQEEYGTYTYEATAGGFRGAEEDGGDYVDYYDSGEEDDYDDDESFRMLTQDFDNIVLEGTVFYDENSSSNFAGVLDLLLNTATENSTFRGIDDTLNVDEFQGMLLRRIKKRKDKSKKKRKPKKKAPVKNRGEIDFKYGGISAFKYGVVRNIEKITPTNCRRGWHADGKICGNTCRVKWLHGNPREKYDADEELFYTKNKEFAKCEACAMWSGFLKPNTPGFFQKSLSHMRKGAPNFCDIENDPSCHDMEMEFASCMGPDVCAEVCWSPIATDRDCQMCYESWCVSHPRAKIHTQYYGICLMFDFCYRKYRPSRYAKAQPRSMIAGIGCWGRSMNELNAATEATFGAIADEDICEQVYRPFKRSYADWNKMYKFCKERTCEPDGVVFNQGRCRDLMCFKICLNGAEFSDECIACKYANGPCNGECRVAKQNKYCNDQCTLLTRLRMEGNIQTTDEFQEALRTCQSQTCVTLFQSGCKQCIGRSEDNGERVYDTALGTNNFRQNFNGWGCDILCEGRNAVILADEEYKKVRRVEMSAFQNMAMGSLDDQTIAELVKYSRRRN